VRCSEKTSNADARDVGFLDGGGETAELIAAYDWSRTPLGSIGSWSRSLRAAVGLVVHSPVAMVLLWGPDGIMLYNDAYAAIARARHPGALGSKCRDTWPEIAAFDDHVLRTALAGGSLSFRDQKWTLPRAGQPEEVWLDVDCSPVLDDDDRPAGALALFFETTARVRERVVAERALRASDSVNRQVLDSAVDYAIIAVDPTGTVTRWNEGARRIMGWSEADMLGQHLARIFTPEDVAAGCPGREMQRALEAGRAGDERWHLRRGGQRFWASGELTPIFDQAHAAVGFVKVLRDRTEQHRADEALRRSEDRLRRAQDAGGVGVFSMDLATRRVSGSVKFFALYGLTARDDTTEAEVAALVVPEDWREIARQRNFDEEAAALEVEYRIQRASDGELRWISRKAEYERDADGKPVRLVGVIQDVTDQRLARREAEENAAQFLTLAQTLPNHVWTGRPDGRLDWFNERIYEYSGAKRGSFDGRGWADSVHPEDRAGLRGRWQRSLASGETFEAEFRLRRHDGAYRWHLARALPIRNDQRQIVRWIGTNTDIHLRKLAEAQTTRDRDRIWALSQEVMLICDFAGVIDAVNPSAIRLLGWSEDEMIGRTISEFVHPEDLRRTAEELAKLARGMKAHGFENRYRTKDGGFRLFDWTAVPDGGRIHAVARDITRERETAEERARIWSSTNDLMGTIGRDGLLRSVNPAWNRLLGYTEEEILARPFAALVVPQDRPQLAAAIARLGLGLPVHDLEHSLRHKDGGHSLIAWSAEPVGAVSYIVGRNVTEQRSAEEALRQSQKMEAVGQLTGGIAHDFNNLLQGITGSLSVIQKRIAQGRVGELDRFIAGAMTSASRAAALTHRLLAFSRRQPLDPRAVRANPLVQSMEDLLRRTLGERIDLQLALGRELWPTMCDPNQLESAILNLVINARDAMPDGGRLSIETRCADLDAAAAGALRDGKPGSYVVIGVTDTGSGMSADTIDRAFEPFFTTKPIGQGTGLGLSMIYGFVRQSGGFVTIDSGLGIGTKVEIYLPVHRGEDQEDDPLQPVTDAGRVTGKNETVLVIEDEEVVRALIVEVLNELGYRALEAVDGPSGLAILESRQRIDLLITDIGLPGLNGRQVADAARQLRPNFKVLFMTGYAENAAVAPGVLEPGMTMITKPFAIETLALRIRESLEE
jgi:PAS domain S-box-containing protein